MILKKLFLFCLFLSLSGASFSQSSAELKRRKLALTREIEKLKKDQNKIASNKRLTLKQINVLNTQIRLREEKIETINSEVKLLNSQISKTTNTVQSLQSQLERLKKEYAGMVLFAFRNQNAYGKLMFIFASNSFNQAYKRLKYLQQFSAHRKKQAKYIQETQKELGMKIVELDQNKRSKTDLLQSEKKEKVTLSHEKEEEAVQLSKLSKQEKKVTQEVAAKKKEVARLNRTIAVTIANEIRRAEAARLAAARAAAAKAAAAKAAAAKAAVAAKSSGSKPAAVTKTPVAKPVSKSANVLSSTPEAAKLSSDFLSNRGRLPWPAQGQVVSRFGINKLGSVTVENNGIDIRTSEGASVQAIFSGEVRRVFPAGSGSAVIIRHGEFFSVYSNLRSVHVSAGEKVNVRQSIGTVIKDPVDGTTQLHFEIFRNTTPVNPLGWLNH